MCGQYGSGVSNRRLTAAIGGIAVLLLAGCGTDRPTATAAPSASSPAPSPSLARLDTAATCVAAVPLATRAADLLKAVADTDNAQLGQLPAGDYRRTADDLETLVKVAAPPIEPQLRTIATTMRRVSVLLTTGGNYTIDLDGIRAAGAGIAEACIAYATR